MVRIKRRYILFELMPNNDKLDELSITERDVLEAIRNVIEIMFGDFGLGSVLQSLQLKRFNRMTRTGVLATKRSVHRLVITSLPFVKRIQSTDASFRTIHLSGTIRGCLRALRIHHNKQIVKLRQELNSLAKIKAIESGVKDIESSLKRQTTSDPKV